MKIAQIVCSFPPYPGGIGQSAWRLGEILSKEHQVDTYTLKGKEKKDKIDNANQKIIYLKPFFRFGHGALTFSLLFSLKKYDCIYLHYPFFGASEILRLFFLFYPKKKLIIHYHMDTPKLPFLKKILSWPSNFSQKFLFNKAEKIIVSSLDYAKFGKIKKYYEKNTNKFIEIPFGVNVESYKPRLSEKHPTPFLQKAHDLVKTITEKIIKKNKAQLLFVGGLDEAHYFKGLKILLQALANLDDINYKLNIIGDGDMRDYYQKLAIELKIDKKIYFRGRVSEEELIRFYQDSDLLILPSVNSHEAFGLVLIEALACGLPVMASNLAGVRSVFTDNIEGLQIKPGDIYDLEKKLNNLLNDKNKLDKMSIAARQLALKKYDQNIIADKLLDEFSYINK